MVVAAALAVAGGVVAVTAYAAGVNVGPIAATSPAPSPKAGDTARSAYCDNFMQHLAGDLKTSQSNLNSQVSKAIGETLADAVKSGDLTQAQADKIKSQLSANGICSGQFAALGRKPGGPHGGAAMQAAVNAAAATLNISPDQLKQQLAQGKTLSQLAPSGMTEDQFKSQFTANLKKELDPRVQAGKLTQAQEDKILQGAPQMVDALWNKGLQRPAKPSPKPTATS